MLINDLDQLTEIFDHVKNDTEILNFEKSSAKMLGLNNVGLQTVSQDHELPAIYPAMRQFLDLCGGRYARHTWNLANEPVIPIQNMGTQRTHKTHNPELVKMGIDLLNARFQHSKGFSQMHVLDKQVKGVTSTNYKKIHSINLLESMNSKMPDAFQRGYHSNTKDTMVFKAGDFKDPLGEEWDLNLQLENNEFGHNAIYLVPSIVRVICTNGMVVTKAKEIIKIKHYGKELNLKALEVGIERLVQEIWEFQDIIIESLKKEIQDTDEFFKKLREKFKFNKDDILKIQEYINLEPVEYQETLYAVGNGISAYANNFSDSTRYEDKYHDLQAIAGMVYSMPMAYA